MNRVVYWIVAFCLLYCGSANGQLVYQLTSKGNEKGAQSVHFFSKDSLDQKIESLIRESHSQGFLNAGFFKKSNGDTLIYEFVQGDRFSWESILIKGDSANLGKLGTPSHDYEGPYQWVENWLIEQEKNGYPFASGKIDSIQVKGQSLSGKIELQLGPLIIWDSVEVIGDTKTDKNYLQRFSKITLGGPFSQAEFDQAVRRLSSNPYVQIQNNPEIQFRTRQAVPVFFLKDRRVNVFDGIVGFLPNANQPGKMLVTGQLDLRLAHLGGKGRDFGINWQKLNVQSQSLDLRAKESYLLGSPLELEFGFNLFKQDSTFVNRKLDLNFSLEIASGQSISFFTQRKAGDLISIPNNGTQSKLIDFLDYRWNTYGVGWKWDKLEPGSFSRKGGRIEVHSSMGIKRLLENTGISPDRYENLEMSSPQWLIEGNGERNFYINPLYGIWVNFSAGHLQNTNLFANELFRLGGLKTIRGFNESFFFAKSYGYINLEHRLFIDSSSYLVFLTDAGIITNPFANPKTDQVLSLGAGINLDTPGGMFSFVLAMGKSSSQPLSITYSRVHFGYLARF